MPFVAIMRYYETTFNISSYKHILVVVLGNLSPFDKFQKYELKSMSTDGSLNFTFLVEGEKRKMSCLD